ncbi:MAG: hypothetical protein CM15mV77_250 [uncultured marine virus]|nr:MAG: hypothetical protein CM15mV77_250 [uncultured marine virus]
MIESVVALLMFVNARLRRHVCKAQWPNALRGKRHAERQYSESVMYKCWKGSAELEDNIDGSKSIKKLIIDKCQNFKLKQKLFQVNVLPVKNILY